jgi:hypothetical protein
MYVMWQHGNNDEKVVPEFELVPKVLTSAK